MGSEMRPRRRTLAFSIILMVLWIALALASCNGDEKPQPTRTSTIPPVITRIVTPLPTNTPLPTPTLPYDIFGVAGDWGMSFVFDIAGGEIATTHSYWGFADVHVGIDGTVTGGGHFQPDIENPPCRSVVQLENPLGFSLHGRTRPVGDQVWVDITLTPDNLYFPETYRIFCPTDTEAQIRQKAILWTMQIALQPREWATARVAGLNWSFALENRQVLTYASDLDLETNGQIRGQLTAEVRIKRN
jgi:hypothetical protein